MNGSVLGAPDEDDDWNYMRIRNTIHLNTRTTTTEGTN